MFKGFFAKIRYHDVLLKYELYLNLEIKIHNILFYNTLNYIIEIANIKIFI